MDKGRGDLSGIFLQTINIGKVAKTDGDTPFDLEGRSKQCLQLLASQSGHSNVEILRKQLDVTSDQIAAVIDYLAKAGMVEKANDADVVLTGFGKDALGVFSVA
jgi:DNA-binding MarR family transcriptional regulator